MTIAAASLAVREPAAHYPSAAERTADRWVHILGLGVGGFGAATLLVLALVRGGLGQAGAILVYALCMMAMLACSAAYNLAADARNQAVWRRVDHACIFLMIAGSYTPFTTQRFDGAWAIGMTSAVWAIALIGAGGKLFLPGISSRFWVGLYLALGWLSLAAIQPFMAGVSVTALVLIAIGGLIYTAGVPIYLWARLRFRRAIWHGFVLTATCVQYFGIMSGVVFGEARL
jgi:hemolysin III